MMAVKPLLPGLCAAICAGCLTLLALRRARQGERTALPPRELPWWLRIDLGMGCTLEPLVATCLPPARSSVLARRLESLGLSPLTPGRWESLRLMHAAGGATLGGFATGFDILWISIAAIAGYLPAGIWLRRRGDAQAMAIGRELPAYLDLMTVCVEAGATLTAGVRLIVAEVPESPLKAYFEHVLREIRGGRPRAQAFSHVAEIYGVESLSTLAGALSHAEGSGMSLGQVLRAQAGQRTAERFARAERLAMQAPVKMLGPLILCIFPCTFIVIAVPIAVRLAEAFGS